MLITGSILLGSHSTNITFINDTIAKCVTPESMVIGTNTVSLHLGEYLLIKNDTLFSFDVIHLPEIHYISPQVRFIYFCKCQQKFN